MDSGNDTECPDRSLVKYCGAGKTDNTQKAERGNRRCKESRKASWQTGTICSG